MSESSEDAVNHPKHYNAHPSGIEVIDIAEQIGFVAGNCFKYLARAPHKGATTQDYEKALWYAKRLNEDNPTAYKTFRDAFANGDFSALVAKWVRADDADRSLRAFAIRAFFTVGKNSAPIDLCIRAIELLIADSKERDGYRAAGVAP